ncbi:MAG: hypothetical protein BGP10_08400 [Rhodanobacter sp. 68-29]|nr:hypothetical protein [Rhodanobacter sp.]ODU75739.1 MAG: hypothetical protein ABT17_03235 [Rhodanobacter sp. SCN 69-32]OJY57026.1 MAG: hypothetical protein BGP10_08400 [Rhodanobacter sp. 68-29]
MKKPLLDRVLMAYRPLYLQGLLLDGQYRLPTLTAGTGAGEAGARRHRLTLLAWTGLHLFAPSARSRK